MKIKHLISIQQLDRETILSLLETTSTMLNDLVIPNKTTHVGNGQLVANLFFEPSTRTCNSFEIAAKRLGALTVTPNLASSALLKGETALDTIHTLQAMGATAIIVRHTEHGIMQTIANSLERPTALINAGEGWLNHPTQALLDLFTIQQKNPDFENLKIAIVGDLYHSRVARSLVDAFSIVGIKDLRLVAPKSLQPEEQVCNKVKTVTSSLEEGLDDTDFIICLRPQKERLQIDRVIPEKDFIENYQLSEKTLRFAKKSVFVMHPGPVNRDLEINSDLLSSPRSLIFQQVRNGVALRMALLNTFFT